MENCCAPQWVDFTDACSPQVPMQDYFEKEHVIHERIMESCDSTITEEAQCAPIDIPCDSEEAQQDLHIIKNTPVKVISPKYGSKKGVIEEQTTYDKVLSDAIRKLELCNKLPKMRDATNKSIYEPNVFKTPNVPAAKSSMSVGFRSVPNKSAQPAFRFAKSSKNICTPLKSDDTSVTTKRSSVSCSLFKRDTACTEGDPVKRLDARTVDDSEKKKEEEKKEEKEEKEKRNEEDNEMVASNLDKAPEEPTNDDKTNDKEEVEEEEEESGDVVDDAIKKRARTQPLGKQRAATSRAVVLTWQNGRRSLNKRRLSSHYVSLAEAVSRFQTETPKRFRTRSNRDLAEKASHNTTAAASRQPVQSHRMRPTIPVSPALTSKNRTRATTVLSQEEREKRELEEMKKYQIKANPIPPSVLRGPVRPVSKVGAARKPMTTTATTTTTTTTTTTATATMTTVAESSSCSSATQRSEKTASVAVPSTRSRNLRTLHHDAAKAPSLPSSSSSTSSSKNIVNKVIVTDPQGIIVEREEITFFGVPKDTGATRSSTRIIPFSFEARNKELQMKREQRLRKLEAGKAKAEFHARPAPNFSKPPLTATVPAAKQQKPKVQPCPFSFDERDKNLFKRKEELVKQVLEKDKQSRVFRANPAPVFKPVMVRGVSKEHLVMKERTGARAEDQENEEPNIAASAKTQQESGGGSSNNRPIRKTKSIAHIGVDKRNVGAPSKSKEQGEANAKTAVALELNTDKRARERREFDEKVKRKEMEEEAKRYEENMKRLEHERQIKAELRKLAEVKAKPIPTYKPMTIIRATKPLTDPQSPAFASKPKSQKQT